ncbi:actin-like protein 6A, partial [Ostrinia furnacalis]|uniref:actin-like protein 6A n=1 Tax=Ostrinia furnacalis TaxID=93504 RepID=UPI00103C466B
MSGPNGMLYGGDEIGALVFDPGHHSLRVGYAQEDTPKADIPAVVGVGPATHIPEAEEKVPDGNVTQSGTKAGNELRHYIDVTELHVARPGMEAQTYMKDGQVDNWDLFEKMLDYCYAKSKEVIRERERARYTLKTLPAGLTHSWQQYMLKRQYEDFCHCIAQVSESAYDERTAASVPGVHYEFPGGYHQDFGPERFKLTECLFEQTRGAPHL